MARPRTSEVLALFRLRCRNTVRDLRSKLPPGALDAVLLPSVLVLCLSLLYGAAHFVCKTNFKRATNNIKLFTTYVYSIVGGMDGFLWMLLSWSIVGGICYFALNKLGITQSEESSQRRAGQSQSNPSGNVSGSKTTNNEWANEVLAWMYNNFHKVPGPMDAWLKSLNDAAKKVTNPSKCEILFEGFGDHSTVTDSPKVRNVRVEQGPRDHLTLRSDVHIPHARLRLVSSQRTPQRLIVSNFDVDILDLRGEVEARIACIAGQLYVMACFSGRPEMDIQLTNTDKTNAAEVNHQLVEEAIRRSLLSSVTNINLSEGTSLRSSSSDRETSPPSHATEAFRRVTQQTVNAAAPTPAYQHYQQQHGTPYQQTNIQSQNVNGTTNGHKETLQSPLYTATNYSQEDGYTNPNTKPVEEMFKKLNDTQLLTPAMNTNTVPNKLRVKVIKAARLGKNIEVHQPYIVIETDEPPQKFQTSKGINASPYWEEQFDFDLTPASEEMLFEVYEGAPSAPQQTTENAFLGLAIVNLEEVRRSGESLHTLNLQGRPYRNDNVQGNITCQFDFYYDPTATVSGKVSDSIVVKNTNGSEFRETVTTQRRVVYDPHDNFDEVVPSKTTTVTVKTVSQTLKEKPTIQSVHGSMENAMDPTTQRQLEQQLREHMHEPLSQSVYSAGSEMSNGKNDGQKSTSGVSSSVVDDRKSRDRSKKDKAPSEKRERSFFGAMRDRLSGRSRSQKRSKSVDLNGAEIEEAVSLPPSRDQSRTRYGSESRGLLETTSVGGRSGESSKSFYQHSTLVLELNHKGQNKYFLIPSTMVAEPAAARLMKKGKKLHIYNEHTFVAVKCRSSLECNVCQQRIGRSFSKQAYQCRDCKLICHKSCHYKTDAFCTNSTVSKLQIAKDVDWVHFLSHYQLEEFISMEGV